MPATENGGKRRRQNAEAQRAYRARQKARVRALEQLAVTAWATGEPMPNGQSSAVAIIRSAPSLSSGPASAAITTGSDSPNCPAATLFRLLFAFPKDASDVVVRIMAKENFFLRDLVKYGLIALGYAMEPSLFDRAAQTTSLNWLGAVQTAYPQLDIKNILTAGVRLLAALDNPPQWPSLEEVLGSSVHPRISADNIMFSPMSYVYAQLLNSQHLRYTYAEMIDYDARSKFYLEDGKEAADAANPGALAGRWSHIARDLRPTEAQMAQEHHPYIDLIPWAGMRDRVLQAVASSDEGFFDEDEFCFDLMHGGLRCWGSTRGSLHGRGEGTPWDARSWEAMPWWLEKWGALAGNEDSEVHRTSAWWRAMRGEDWEVRRGGGSA